MKHLRLKFSILPLYIMIAISVYANKFNVDGISYSINSDEKSVTVISGGAYSGDLIIPSEVSNDQLSYVVTAIGNSAFLDCSTLSSVAMPNTITYIGYCAFGGCI